MAIDGAITNQLILVNNLRWHVYKDSKLLRSKLNILLDWERFLPDVNFSPIFSVIPSFSLNKISARKEFVHFHTFFHTLLTVPHFTTSSFLLYYVTIASISLLYIASIVCCLLSYIVEICCKLCFFLCTPPHPHALLLLLCTAAYVLHLYFDVIWRQLKKKTCKNLAFYQLCMYVLRISSDDVTMLIHCMFSTQCFCVWKIF